MLLLLMPAADAHAVDLYDPNLGEVISLTLIEDQQNSMPEVSWYSTAQGQVLGVTDQLLLKLQKDADLDGILGTHDMTLLHSLGPRLYLVRVKSFTPDHEDTIRKANILNDQSGVLYAHPDLVSRPERR